MLLNRRVALIALVTSTVLSGLDATYAGAITTVVVGKSLKDALLTGARIPQT
jgi:hypothetical protein